MMMFLKLKSLEKTIELKDMDYSKLEDKYQQLKDNYDNLEKSQVDVDELSSLKEQVNEKDLNIRSLTSQNEASESKIAELEKTLTTRDNEISELKSELDSFDFSKKNQK